MLTYDPKRSVSGSFKWSITDDNQTAMRICRNSKLASHLAVKLLTAGRQMTIDLSTAMAAIDKEDRLERELQLYHLKNGQSKKFAKDDVSA